MIVREIESDEKYLANFDYFNDYKDTRNFLVRKENYKLMNKLDEGYCKWQKERSKKWKQE